MTENRQAFHWIGIGKNGRRLTGTVHAVNIEEARSVLKKQDIEIISLQRKNQFSFFTKKQKIKTKDILLFTRFLSTMLSVGMPIVQSLEVIDRDQENATMRSVIGAIKSNITGGKTLSDSFSQHPLYFNSLYCNLIKAGESSGTLDKILKRLVIYIEKTRAIKQKIKKALVYPIAIITVALVVSLILLIFVVPQFQGMFKSFGAPLPLFTQWVVNLSGFIRGYWWLIILNIGISIFAFKKLAQKNQAFANWLDKISLKIYIIGPILQKAIIARFTRTLATTMDAGMPLVESMKAMADIMGNKIYKDAVYKICSEVVNGQQLNVAMNATNLFPNIVIQMIAVGETSGTLSEMMNKVADYYEEEVSQIVDNLSSLLEPLIMVLLGIIIGGFVIAMYLPIFKIGSLF